MCESIIHLLTGFSKFSMYFGYYLLTRSKACTCILHCKGLLLLRGPFSLCSVLRPHLPGFSSVVCASPAIFKASSPRSMLGSVSLGAVIFLFLFLLWGTEGTRSYLSQTAYVAKDDLELQILLPLLLESLDCRHTSPATTSQCRPH